MGEVVIQVLDMASESCEPSRLSISDTSPSRTSRTGYSFMEKRQQFLCVVDHIDCTPDNIVDPDYVTMEDTFSHAAFESKSRPGFTAQQSKLQSKSGTEGTGGKVYATTISLDDIHIDHTLNTETGIAPADIDLEIAPSAFYLPKAKPLMSYPPNITVLLKETPTAFLFELPSISLDKNDPVASQVEEQNEYYQFITVGKGRNRKMVVEETQTQGVVTQTRHTLATRPEKKNAMCFASMWDMYDTYEQLAAMRDEPEEDEMVLYQSAAPEMLRHRKKVIARRGKTFEDIGANPKFYDAAMLVDRVIASLQFSRQQKKFRGLVVVDPLSPDLVYVYTMQPLWTFDYEETAGKSVANISFNSKNENILAVAYGKFAYSGPPVGLVGVWCTKNPCKPERLYRFECPVTSVAFSYKNPNWLACGFENGDVIILDVTSHPLNTIAHSTRNTNPCFEPIWSVGWRAVDRDTEFVMSVCQDGRINRLTSTKTHDFICSPMMRISTVEGKLKGLEVQRTCVKADVPITRYPGVLCMQWHPAVEHVYLVGTDEGCVHKCSSHYLNQHMDVFRAHAGPVYDMQYSPFMRELLVTCGADGCVRLWIDGMDEVIMTLWHASAVYGVAFCPINSTIVLSISGNTLSVWDLRRKIHMPCAESSFPHNAVLTYLRFSDSGDNVFVGDSLGRIHAFHLEDTPIPPYYQKRMLDEALKKALCTRPQLLKQLKKLEQLRQKI